MTLRPGLTISIVLMGLSLQGCALLSNTRSTEAQLQRVAKDWCMTIRASQVLCTYPLTEDVQVGDLYVVTTSIEDQTRQYRDRGFLPFDLLLWRLQPKGYEEMYRGFYNTRGFVDVVPHQWQFPANATNGTTDWGSAPAAAFPTYKFSVKRGQGLNLAVPVQSVPVGLALMNTGTATGSIDIDDASTYGVPLGFLERQVDEWASCPRNRDLLARFAPTTDPKTGKEKQQFVRVIARVYVTGKVNVALQNDEARSAGVDAGTAQPVTLVTGSQDLQAVANANDPGGSAPAAASSSATPATTPATGTTTTPATAASASSTTTTTSATTANLSGTTIAKSAPGGSIRIAAVSSRAISMSETFARPLVIGYIAFDRPIGRGGVLGDSVPTLQRVEKRVAEPVAPASQEASSSTFNLDQNGILINWWLKTPGNRQKLKDFLAQKNVPSDQVPNVEFGDEFAALREEIVQTFAIGANCG